MTTFNLRKDVPPLHVTVPLLVELEDYLLSRAAELFPEEKATLSFHCEIEDKLGKETLDSVKDHHGSSFSDSTKRIRFFLYTYKGGMEEALTVGISLENDKDSSRISIECKGVRPREIAVGIYQNIIQILERYNNGNWFFHPWAGIIIILYIVWPLLFVAELIIPYTKLAGTKWALASLLAPVIIYFYLQPARQITNPFISFESRKAKTRSGMSKFLYAGFASFVIFGCFAPFFAKLIKSALAH